MRRPRYYFVTYESAWGDRSGEWIIQTKLMAELVVRRIREIDPDCTVDLTEIKVHDSVSSWEREAWPLSIGASAS